MKIIYLLFFIIGLVYASEENNNSCIVQERSFIDRYHDMLDIKVYQIGRGIDNGIASIFNLFGDAEEDEQNLTQKQSHETVPLSACEEVDEFFLTRKLLEEREKSYVRVSYIRWYNSLEQDNDKIKVRARLDIPRTRKRYRLFIDDYRDESKKNIAQPDKQSSTSIGLEALDKKRFGIKSQYRLGVRSIVNPFARARFSYEKQSGAWRLQPVQTFLYSLKHEFSETTDLYLDTPTSDLTFLRFVLNRGTQSRVPGMSYNGNAQWFWTPRKGSGLSFNMGFNGSTKYQNIIDATAPVLIKEENRVFNYPFSVNWRENILKPWLFYEIAPGVNYHEAHGYRPNYNIYFKIDLFFGHV